MPTAAGLRLPKETRECPAGIPSCLPAFPAGRIVRELIPEKNIVIYKDFEIIYCVILIVETRL